MAHVNMHYRRAGIAGTQAFVRYLLRRHGHGRVSPERIHRGTCHSAGNYHFIEHDV
jgi:hypothetical protein